ncbi:hypothetical protein SAMN04515668_4976 [Hymenobacter arizonensis]|uniref:Uncharacterized protein n=1 Tax=Hymenobacter arizonensis TaxID=1227077 RepID=A0A1I6BRC7_HYMAR|nr:hypothetical protein SAMN04515668_4976 [Hymenobacter arizonensis]
MGSKIPWIILKSTVFYLLQITVLLNGTSSMVL